MSSLRFLAVGAAATVLSVAPALAQSIISAHSGLIHYVEGQATLDGKTFEQKPGVFEEVKEKSVLKTAEGRAEILLTPGTILRLAENSGVRMVTNRLVDTRLEVLEGSVILEVAEIVKDSSVSLVYKDATLTPLKKGLYRVEAATGMVRVYDGELIAESGNQRVTVKEAKELNLGGAWAVNKFDNKTGDAFYRWARRRAEYLAMANVTSAKSLVSSGRTWSTSGWYWNPYLSMFTYVPYSGLYSSPFGYSFYSPVTVIQAYQPVQMNSGNRGGWNSGGSNTLGYSPSQPTSMGTSSTVNATVSSPAPAASSGRATSGGDSGGRGGSHGR